MFILAVATFVPLAIACGSLAVVIAYRPRPTLFIRPTAALPCRTVLTPR